MTATADPSLLDADEALRQARTDADAGLTSDEAARRLAHYGPNRLDAKAAVPAWRKLLAQFTDPLIYLLLAAVVVSTLAWWLRRVIRSR